jgi:hypothetical protein
MRPFTRAVDFVYTDHADLSTKLSQIFHEKSLRGNKQHFYLFLLDGFYNLLFQLVVLLTIDGSPRNEVRQLAKLVRHQRN